MALGWEAKRKNRNNQWKLFVLQEWGFRATKGLGSARGAGTGGHLGLNRGKCHETVGARLACAKGA